MLVLRPRIIIGGERISFMKYLDLFLLNNNKRGKQCIALSVGLVAFHFIITKLVFPDNFKFKRRSRGVGDA